MKLTKASARLLAAALVAVPSLVAADGWMSPHLSSWLEEMEDNLPSPFLRKSRSSYPPHEVIDNEDTFQVILDLQGVPDEAVAVSLEDNGMTLLVHGHREVEGENYRYQSSFSQRFGLGPSVQADQMVATRRDDGALIVTAPKGVERQTSRQIPIQSVRAIRSGLAKNTAFIAPAEDKTASAFVHQQEFL